MGNLTTQYIDLGNARIAYREHGNGPTLLLLHGNSESKNIFTQYQLKHFDMFRTIAIDSRGHGESQSDNTNYSIEQYSSDVIEICKAKNITRACVLGYSDGGNISLFLAQKAPELFPKIVAISPNYLVSGTTDSALRLFRAIRGVVSFASRLGFNTKKEIAKLDLMLRDIGITDDDLRSIRTDMKILYAEKELIKEEHIKRIASFIPNASVDKIMGCHHMTILNKMEAIEVMKAYLLEKTVTEAGS
ncbi:MAG: alpha/beta hydrolase [Chloroflexi bacterium]|nr:alpha/beta hydrolase [Chloroflexota bacterium]